MRVLVDSEQNNIMLQVTFLGLGQKNDFKYTFLNSNSNVGTPLNYLRIKYNLKINLFE